VGFVDVVTHPTEHFSFRKASTQEQAEKYGVTSATFTARRPG
jgi:hypothetical protein